jgi:hypothetical protein
MLCLKERTKPGDPGLCFVSPSQFARARYTYQAKTKHFELGSASGVSLLLQSATYLVMLYALGIERLSQFRDILQ